MICLRWCQCAVPLVLCSRRRVKTGCWAGTLHAKCVFFAHSPPFCSYLLTPHDMLKNESRDFHFGFHNENQDSSSPGPTPKKADVVQSSPRVSFLATRKLRQEPIPQSSSGSGMFIRFSRQGPKARSDCRTACQILSVHNGDGRSTDHPQSNVVESLRASEFIDGEDNDIDAVEVEEGRFSCMYWSSQQAARDAKLGILVVTSDHISFEISDRNMMRCFFYEVNCPAPSLPSPPHRAACLGACMSNAPIRSKGWSAKPPLISSCIRRWVCCAVCEPSTVAHQRCS
jgi:hypothetical protein